MSLEELKKLLEKEKEDYKKEIFEEEGLIDKSDDEEEEEEEDEEEDDNDGGDDEDNNNGDDGFNQDELRKYEKSRMRYYFAVVECDSVATANAIYENCDGVQLVSSSNALDLRYIPDDTTFKYPPRDTATEVPANYKPPTRSSIVVDQTNVRLTWDETPQERIALTRQDFKKSGKSDQDLEDDFKAYLASDSSESEDDSSDEDGDDDEGERERTEEERKEILNRKREKIRKKYQALLGGLDGNDMGEAETNEDGETMEITFTPGLYEKAEELLRKKETDKEMAGLTPWEKYLERRKKKAEDKKQKRKEEEIAEKRAARMRKAGVKGPSSQKDEAEEEKRRQAELELLMIDEKDAKASGLPGATTTAVNEEEEVAGPGKKRKGSRQMSKKKRREAEEKEESGDFMINTEDKRFESLFTSHDFAMDPTHPEFKKNRSTAAIMEKRNKERTKMAEDDEKEAVAMAAAAAARTPEEKEKSEVMMLAESIKRRAKEAEVLKKKKMKK